MSLRRMVEPMYRDPRVYTMARTACQWRPAVKRKIRLERWCIWFLLSSRHTREIFLMGAGHGEQDEVFSISGISRLVSGFIHVAAYHHVKDVWRVSSYFLYFGAFILFPVFLVISGFEGILSHTPSAHREHSEGTATSIGLGPLELLRCLGFSSDLIEQSSNARP
jgi:hypothetical protein